jgi:hypothetical protein
MKGTAILTFGICLLAVLSSCGGQTETPAANNKATNSGNNRAATTGTPNGPTANQPASTPGGDGNAAINGNAVNPLTAAKNRKIEMMRQSSGDPSAANVDVEAILKQTTSPAPENSEFAVALTKVVVERRTFLKHPILSRVEKITDGTKSTIKLSTTDGKTIDLLGGAIKNLSVASSASILKAAGLQTPQAQPSDKKPGAANRN